MRGDPDGLGIRGATAGTGVDQCNMLDSSSPVATAMAQVASRQHGIVDVHELIGLGLTRSTIAYWARTGRIHRLHRGVYSVVPPPLLSAEGRWLAAVRACGPGAVLSHGSAAQLLWLLDRRESVGLHVSLGDRRRREPDGVVVHRPRDLPRTDVVVRSGIPVTSPTRTVWDIATTMPQRLTGRAFRKADGWDRLDRARLMALLRATPNHAGSANLRELLGSATVPLVAVRSWLEELLALVCAEHSLPPPAVNVPFLGYEIDFLWERERFAVEADGGDHVGPQRDRDNERDIALGRAGILTRRYSSRAMGDEAAVAREVAEILIERRR